MVGWKIEKLSEILELIYGKSLPKSKRIEGTVPVYGSNGIVGYHDEPIVDKPGIIVGRKGSAGNVAFSNVPFCPIDTTFFITQDHTSLDLKFLYYALENLDLKRILGDVGVPGLNREMAYLEQLRYPESLPEQKKIAYILSTIQKAIKQQDKLIQITTELKKALMQKLFTEGLHGEPQKETEIGLVPESWVIDKLGENSIIRTSYPTMRKVIENFESNQDGETFHYLKVSDMNLEGNSKYFSKSNISFKNKEPQRFSKGFLKPGSLVFPKRGAAISTNKKRITTKFSVLDPNLIGVEPFDRIDIRFLYYFFEMFNLVDLQDNNVVPQLNKHNVAGVSIPIPPKSEQLGIIDIIEKVEKKLENHKSKKQTLTDLFKTLLHELMTGQRRVNDLEFEGMTKEYKMEEQTLSMAAEE